MKKSLLALIALCLVFINCERDDICPAATPTTPRLLIEFYDVTSTDDLKNVPRLTVYGEDLFLENGTLVPPETASNSTIVFNANDNAIELPLIVNNEGDITTTTYVLERDTNLRLDEDTTTESNIDIINISYTTEFIYVSRACGYKSIFNNLDIEIDIDNDTDQWINNIIIDEITVENEDTIHVRIFH